VDASVYDREIHARSTAENSHLVDEQRAALAGVLEGEMSVETGTDVDVAQHRGLSA
jgi:hypothetical protein